MNKKTETVSIKGKFKQQWRQEYQLILP